MNKKQLIDRLTNNERAFYFLSKDEQDFMRKWPHGVSGFAWLGRFFKPRSGDFYDGVVYRLNPAPPRLSTSRGNDCTTKSSMSRWIKMVTFMGM